MPSWKIMSFEPDGFRHDCVSCTDPRWGIVGLVSALVSYRTRAHVSVIRSLHTISTISVCGGLIQAQPNISEPDDYVPQGSICYAVDEGFVSCRYINIGTVLEICSISISLGRVGHPNAAATFQRCSL